jgi:lysophospholipase L1-like esterase
MKSNKLITSVIFLFAFSQLQMYDHSTVKKKDLDIVYIGNSITQGAQLDNPQDCAPPAVSAKCLMHKPGIGKVSFINEGKSGFTSVDYLPGITGALADVIAATYQLHKENHRLLVFTISLGTNDSAEQGPNGSPVAPEAYQNNIKAIVDKLLSDFPESKIVLLQPIWYSPNTYNNSRYMSEGLARLQSYFPELQALVDQYSQTNPDHVYLGDLKGFAYFRNNYLTDLIPESGNAGTFYLHPNKKGANVLGKLWGDAIYDSIFRD